MKKIIFISAFLLIPFLNVFASAVVHPLIITDSVFCEGDVLLKPNLQALFSLASDGWKSSKFINGTYSNFSHGNNLVVQDNDYYIFYFAVNTLGDTLFSDTVRITVHANKVNTDTQVSCGPYMWDGQVYYHTGYYQSSFATSYGCDSVVTLKLTVNDNKQTCFDISECDSYVWNDVIYTKSGLYRQILQTTQNCDSIVSLNLTIRQSTASVDVQSACDSYTWYGSTYTASTDTTTHTITNASGCDSVITLNLTINNGSHSVKTLTECESYIWNGMIFDISCDTVYRYTNAAGCASVDTLHVTIHNGTFTVFDTTVCDSYTWHDKLRTVSDEYIYTYINTAGCMSADTLHLTVNHTTTGNDVHVECDSFTWMDGNNYTESNNTATHTIANVAGCDSIVTLILTLNHGTHNAETMAECESYIWNGMIFDTSCDTVCRYTNAAGCASVDTLHVTIHNGTFTVFDTTVCDSYTWHDKLHTVSDEYIYTYVNTAGCMSADTLHLTVNHTTIGNDVHVECDSFTWMDGNNYTESNNTATHTIANVAGCDSIVTLILTLNHGTHNVNTEQACDEYRWHDRPYTLSGDYVVQYMNETGCPSTDTLRLTIHHTPNEPIVDGPSSVCMGQSAMYRVQNYDNENEYTWSFLGDTTSYSYNGKEITHRFQDAGELQLTCKAINTDFRQCSSRSVRLIAVSDIDAPKEMSLMVKKGNGTPIIIYPTKNQEKYHYVWFRNNQKIESSYDRPYYVTKPNVDQINDEYFVQVSIQSQSQCVNNSQSVTLNMNPKDMTKSLSTSPNPNNGTFAVTFAVEDEQPRWIEVISATGNIVARQEMKDCYAQFNLSLNCGSYLIRVVTYSGETYTEKFIVNK